MLRKQISFLSIREFLAGEGKTRKLNYLVIVHFVYYSPLKEKSSNSLGMLELCSPLLQQQFLNKYIIQFKRLKEIDKGVFVNVNFHSEHLWTSQLKLNPALVCVYICACHVAQHTEIIHTPHYTAHFMRADLWLISEHGQCLTYRQQRIHVCECEKILICLFGSALAFSDFLVFFTGLRFFFLINIFFKFSFSPLI